MNHVSLMPEQHLCQHSRLAEACQSRQHRLRVHAARQGPEPWDVVETQQQTTAWQQRQQQQLNRQREWRHRKQRGAQPGRSVISMQRSGPPGHSARQPSSHPFAACLTYQTLYAAAQQLVMAGQQQQQQLPAASEDAQGAAPLADEGSAAPGVCVQHDPPQQQTPGLTAQDCVQLVSQLAVISRNLHGTSSSSSSPSSSANQFMEDQALQHTLALVYASIDDLLQQQQQQQQQHLKQEQSSSCIPPQQLLKSVSILAGLKYTQPVQLAAWLEAAAADAAQCDPAASGLPVQPAVGSAPAAGTAAGTANIGGHRQVLMRLRAWELAALVSHLPHAGVRPSNVWLLAFMQVALDKLSSAALPQLAQLLSGLVKLGVKPTTSWMDAMEDRALQRLLEHAVRQQVDAEQQQQQQHRQQQQQQQTQLSQQQSTANIQHSSSSSSSMRSAGPGQQGRSSTARRRKQPGGCDLHHVALLLSALAEARHQPKPQLAAVLWGATADSLAAADGPVLVELLTALGELQLLPPDAWLKHYFAASSRDTVLQQYKPWQLASSIAALGKLAAASPAGSRPSQPGQQQQQQNKFDPLGCNVWAAALLGAMQKQLPSASGRDLAAVLSGLAALELQLEPDLLQQLLTELQSKLPRLNAAGLASVSEAALAFTGQQQQQLPATFMEALLREIAVKLPVFPADDLARVLLAVAAAGIQPSQLWVQAAAAQLGGKLTLLEPGTLLAVLKALVVLGAAPDSRWLQQAVIALDGRLLDLTGPQLQELLSLLASLGASPPTAWLDSADWAMQQQLDGQETQAVAVVSTTRQQ